MPRLKRAEGSRKLGVEIFARLFRRRLVVVTRGNSLAAGDCVIALNRQIGVLLDLKHKVSVSAGWKCEAVVCGFICGSQLGPDLPGFQVCFVVIRSHGFQIVIEI